MTNKVYIVDSEGTYFHGLEGTLVRMEPKAKRGPLILLEVFHKGMEKKVRVAFHISKVREKLSV